MRCTIYLRMVYWITSTDAPPQRKYCLFLSLLAVFANHDDRDVEIRQWSISTFRFKAMGNRYHALDTTSLP